MSSLLQVTNFRTVNNESLLFTSDRETGELAAHLIFNHTTRELSTHHFPHLPRHDDSIGLAEFLIVKKDPADHLSLIFDGVSYPLAEVNHQTSPILSQWLIELNHHLREHTILNTR